MYHDVHTPLAVYLGEADPADMLGRIRISNAACALRAAWRSRRCFTKTDRRTSFVGLQAQIGRSLLGPRRCARTAPEIGSLHGCSSSNRLMRPAQSLSQPAAHQRRLQKLVRHTA